MYIQFSEIEIKIRQVKKKRYNNNIVRVKTSKGLNAKIIIHKKDPNFYSSHICYFTVFIPSALRMLVIAR